MIGGRRDQLDRTTLHSPVRGIVKNLEVTTIGGVIQPGGSLMEIVPLEDQLLIEARVSPRDIAFIRPGQPATVKITAYDPSIYGTLPGTVDRISPDTLQDEVHAIRSITASTFAPTIPACGRKTGASMRSCREWWLRWKSAPVGKPYSST